MKALFFDIDGTLVSLRTKVYSESTRRSLARLRAQGNLCFVATGRSIFEIREEGLLDGLEFDGYLTNNGQIVYDAQQRPLFGQPLHEQDVAAVLDWVEQAGCACWLVTADRSVLNHMDARVEAAMTAIHTKPPRLGSLREAAREPVYKIVLFLPREQMEQVMQCTCHSRTTQWFPLGHDLISKDGGKLWAMEQTLKAYGVDRADSMAFGDGENDIEMLRGAGVGVAMGNADEAVKRAADYVTRDVDDDGLEYALRKFSLL